MVSLIPWNAVRLGKELGGPQSHLGNAEELKVLSHKLLSYDSSVVQSIA
jgi:hypothetical protein